MKRSRPRPVLTLAIVLLAGAVLAAACNGDDGMSDSSSSGSGSGAKTVTITSETMTTVSLTVGEHLVLSLDSNPTTGYSWKALVSDPTVVQATGSKDVRPKNAAIGAGGKQNLSFTALKKGQSTLELTYDRPFAEGSPGNKTIAYTVTVH